LALEELEALRWLDYLRPEGVVIANNQQMKPLPVAVGLQEYPQRILKKIKGRAGRVVVVDGVCIARQVGSMRALNIAMLGSLAALLNLDPARLRRIIRKKLPPGARRANLAAFKIGWAEVGDAQP
jgi:indolepyruvate ferredoxin oxidoreductase beta subunit